MNNNRIINLALVAVVAAVVALGSVKLTKSGTGASTTAGIEQKESVYNRIIRTGVIRAGYITYPPAVIKDTVTGKLSGTFVEILEEVAKNLGVKLEWTEEVGWGAQIEGLKSDRYDIIGSPVWANPNRGKLTTMSIPVYYSGIGVWVRANDSRFDADLSKINAPDVRIGTIDGETADLIARTSFPSAQRVSSPQLTDISEKFLEIRTGKADVVLTEPFFGFEFLKNNKGTVKNIAAAKPIQVLGNCYMFKENEFQMKGMLDVAIEGLLNSGFVDRVLNKYEPYPGTFYRVADPYKPTGGSR
jgi:ABC-type amino acid transport/signal transduction systems, periplasmic component/domain